MSNLSSEGDLRWLCRQGLSFRKKSLQAEGWSQRTMADHLQMSRRTVMKYWSLDAYPKRQPAPQQISSVTPFFSYLTRRWQEGCQNCKQLFEEVRTQGYAGSYVSVWRAIKHLAADQSMTLVGQNKPQPIPALSAQRAAWLFSTPSDTLTPDQRYLRDALYNICPGAADIYRLAEPFGDMIRNLRQLRS